MFKKILILIGLAFCFSVISEANAQTILKDNKIPKDLVITYKTNGRCQSELRINSNRKVLLNLISCVPFSEISLYEKVKKRDRRISKNRLKELISKFEEIDFFKLKEDYSRRNNDCKVFFSDTGTTEIYIQINAKNKKVFYENGCINENDKTIAELRNLGERIDQIQREILNFWSDEIFRMKNNL